MHIIYKYFVLTRYIQLNPTCCGTNHVLMNKQMHKKIYGGETVLQV